MDTPTEELIDALKAVINLAKASGFTFVASDGEDLDLYDQNGWIATLTQVEVD